MEIIGAHRIKASREEVWRALNDPEVLMEVIPGCESMVSRGPNNFEATVRVAVGPIRARFAGAVTLQDRLELLPRGCGSSVRRSNSCAIAYESPH